MPDPIDQKVAQLMIDGERSYNTYVEAMGIEELPEQQRNRKIKRAKDRLKARLKRANWSDIFGQGHDK